MDLAWNTMARLLRPVTATDPFASLKLSKPLCPDWTKQLRDSKSKDNLQAITALDFRTGYDTMAVLCLPGDARTDDINVLKLIQYVKEYPLDPSPHSKPSDIVPVTLYFGATPQDPTRWDWEVLGLLKHPGDAIHDHPDHTISALKLLSDNTEVTLSTRVELKRKAKVLMDAGFIEREDELVGNFLTH